LFDLWRQGLTVRAAAVSIFSLAMFAVIIRNYCMVGDPGQRRRIKWAMWGMFVALAPAVHNHELVTDVKKTEL
jgi:hypothetical protein